MKNNLLLLLVCNFAVRLAHSQIACTPTKGIISRSFNQWEPDCQGVDPGTLISDPFDCNLYWQCNGEHPVPKQCPNDLHFNAETCHCDYPEVAGCLDRTTTTTTTSTTTPPPECPPGWLLQGNNCFFVGPFEEKLTWFEADLECKNMGGYLAEIKRKEENDLIVQYLFSNIAGDETFFNDFWWLGGGDFLSEGDWVWNDSQTSVEGSAGYNNWAEGEPFNCADGKCDARDCLAMHRYFSAKIEYFWSDQRCESLAGYICQKSGIQ